MSSIITFYSYKGGVGRSMALANIALLLARRGLKVLVVDWDLEAPGIERYFADFEIVSHGPGLLRLFMKARELGSADFRQFTSFFQCDCEHPITLLTSGRDQDAEYTRNLEEFDWERFFQGDGGKFMEHLRDRWRVEFDIVLIDSRTGLSDTGGICTIQMPDIVVAMFTANYQSLFGVRDVMRLAQRARQQLAYDRMPLTVLPLPARWGTHEFQETKVWLDRIAEAVQEFYVDWLPSNLAPRAVLESIKIPQSDYFGFGEKLAVVDQGVTDPQGMGYVYNKIAHFLAGNLSDLTPLLGEQALSKRIHPDSPAASQSSSLPDDKGYLYDIFVSYDRSSRESMLQNLEQLRKELKLHGRPLRIFMDMAEIRLGSAWDPQIEEALEQSRIVVSFVTSSSKPESQPEFVRFLERSRTKNTALVALILMRGGEDYWESLRSYGVPMFDLRSIGFRKSPSTRWTRMQDIAISLINMVEQAPVRPISFMDDGIRNAMLE
jgi:MinD-like ATPase involved in chromosome partitioning or flagellar assembly